MKKIRLIIKKTFQPPIDTKATSTFHTIDIECKELEEMFENNDLTQLNIQVIGAEYIINNN